MTKKFITLLLVSLLVLTCIGSAYAVTGDDYSCEDVEFVESGYATFILDNSSRICGVLKPNEELDKVGYQTPKNKHTPSGIEDGMALRRRVFARVCLDDEYKVLKGGKQLEVTIKLTNLELVEEVLGEEATVENIIDATIYSPNINCEKTFAAHMFLGQNTDRVKVGEVIFNCEKRLDIYVGHFFGDCRLVIGFRAKPNPAPAPTCQPAPPCEPPCELPPVCPPPCVPVPCPPSVVVTTTTTTQVTTTTTTTTTIGQGCNK